MPECNRYSSLIPLLPSRIWYYVGRRNERNARPEDPVHLVAGADRAVPEAVESAGGRSRAALERQAVGGEVTDMNGQELAARAVRASSPIDGYPFRLELLTRYGVTEARRLLRKETANFLAEPIDEESTK